MEIVVRFFLINKTSSDVIMLLLCENQLAVANSYSIMLIEMLIAFHLLIGFVSVVVMSCQLKDGSFHCFVVGKPCYLLSKNRATSIRNSSCLYFWVKFLEA